MDHAHNRRRVAIDDITAPVDLADQVLEGRMARRRAARAAGQGLDDRPLVAEEQLRGAQTGGDQLFQPQGGRGVPPGKLGHKSDARLLDAALDGLRLLGVHFQADRAINCLPRLAGRQDRKRSEPLGRKHHDGVDVFALDQRVVAVHRFGLKLGCRQLGAMLHLIADRPDLEPVGQRPQCRGVPRLPSIPQADKTHAKSHGTPSIAVSNLNRILPDYIGAGRAALQLRRLRSHYLAASFHRRPDLPVQFGAVWYLLDSWVRKKLPIYLFYLFGKDRRIPLVSAAFLVRLGLSPRGKIEPFPVRKTRLPPHIGEQPGPGAPA